MLAVKTKYMYQERMEIWMTKGKGHKMFLAFDFFSFLSPARHSTSTEWRSVVNAIS